MCTEWRICDRAINMHCPAWLVEGSGTDEKAIYTMLKLSALCRRGECGADYDTDAVEVIEWQDKK